jgi:O-antigen/teichoic acid export membrane protein
MAELIGVRPARAAVLTGEGAPPPLGGATTSAVVVRGGAWSVVSRIVPQVQILALSVVAARYLGPDGLGRQSLIAFTALSLTMVATSGVPPALSRSVAELLGSREPGAARGVYRWAVRVLHVLAIGATTALLVVVLLGGDPAGAWVLAGLGSGIAVLQAAPAALLLGSQRWRQAAAPGLITGVVSVPAIAVVLAAGGGIVGFFAVETLMLGINLVWVRSRARRLTAAWPVAETPDSQRRRGLARVAGMATIVSAIELVVWRRSELFVLGHWSTDAEIAAYSIAFAATWGLARIPGAVAAVTMPAAANLVGAGETDRLRSGCWRAARLLLVATLPLAALAAALGPRLIELVYGHDFSAVRDPLLVLLLPLPLLPLVATSSALLFALGRLRALIITGLAAAAVDISLALVLVPRHDALGAAAASVVSQLCAGVPQMALARRVLAPTDLDRHDIGCAIVTAGAAGAAAWLTAWRMPGGPGAVVGGCVGAMAWLGLTWWLRPLRRADASWLGDALGGPVAIVLRRASR